MKKFVIVKDKDGELSIRLSNCVECHFELVSKDTKCIGGGHFHIDRQKNSVYLYGHSIDYGKATIEDCAKALEDTLSSWTEFDFYFSTIDTCPVSLDIILANELTKIYTAE